MQTRVADELVRDDLSSQIQSAIQDAIRQFERERYRFNEKRYHVLTVANQEYYDLDSSTLLNTADNSAVASGIEMIEVDRIECLISGQTSVYRVVPRTQDWFTDNQTPSVGDPTDYGFFGNQLRLYPIPRGVATLKIYGLARLATLSVSGDTNAWMVEAEPVIRHMAKFIINRDVLYDEDGKAGALQALFGTPVFDFKDGALPQMQSKHSAQGYTGSIKPWSL
jgi:hypothetical protein